MHSNSLKNLKKGNAAPRCTYVRLNEQTCTQPALHGGGLCRFHDFTVANPLKDTTLIPFVEDATTLQYALMQVIKSLQSGRMTRPVAGTILYALQIAAQNLPRLCEEIGHPFADRAAPKKKQADEDEEDDFSLAEYLIEQLQLTPPPIDDEEDQKTAGAHHRMTRSPDGKIPSSPNSGVIDDIKACIGLTRTSASRRSPANRAARRCDGRGSRQPSLASTPATEGVKWG